MTNITHKMNRLYYFRRDINTNKIKTNKEIQIIYVLLLNLFQPVYQ